MPTPPKDFTGQRAKPYEVTWKGNTVGFTEDVDPSGMKVLERVKQIEELEGITVDIEAYGFEGVVSMTLTDVGPERVRQLCPWAGSTGGFSLTPPTAGYSYYGAAGALVIHPKGVSGTASDFQFMKAFPRIKGMPKSAGGKTWSKLVVEFVIFPDQTAMLDASPTVVGGYQGPIPTP